MPQLCQAGLIKYGRGKTRAVYIHAKSRENYSTCSKYRDTCFYSGLLIIELQYLFCRNYCSINYSEYFSLFKSRIGKRYRSNVIIN